MAQSQNLYGSCRGDDTNEPISDTVRGIIDGHMSFQKGCLKNHYPAIEVLESVSVLCRKLPKEQKTLAKMRNLLSIYNSNYDLVSIGAYKRTNPALDEALRKIDKINEFYSRLQTKPLTMTKLLRCLLMQSNRFFFLTGGNSVKRFQFTLQLLGYKQQVLERKNSLAHWSVAAAACRSESRQKGVRRLLVSFAPSRQGMTVVPITVFKDYHKSLSNKLRKAKRLLRILNRKFRSSLLLL